MAPGRPFLANTSATTFVIATEVSGVVGAPDHRGGRLKQDELIQCNVIPFQSIVSPHAMAMAEFHPYTATGKLKAVMIPMTPRGFQFSRRAWPGLSLGMT